MFYRLFYPRQTCMLSASHEGKSNVTIVDWVTPASVKPPMVAVALNNKSYSLELVSSSKSFVLSVLPESMREKAVGVGSASGKVIDKVEEYQLALKPAKTVKAPLLDGAVAWVECEVVAIFNAGDHSVVIGEVLETHFPEEEAARNPMLFNWGSKSYFGIQRDWREEKAGREREEKHEEVRLVVTKEVRKDEEKREKKADEKEREEKKDPRADEKEAPREERKENPKPSA